jgi:hypothetical protein
MYTLTALATVLLLCSLLVIPLSKMILPRCFILFTVGMICPFSCSRDCFSRVEKYMAWEFPSLIFMFQRSCTTTPQQRSRIVIGWEHGRTRPSCSLMFLCRPYISIVLVEATQLHVPRGIDYTILGQGRNFGVPHRYFSRRRKFAFYRDSKFSVSEERNDLLNETYRNFWFFQFVM